MSGIVIISWIIGILVLIGACFNLLGALGLVRFPDVYLRSHAATKSVTLGVICILVATFFYFWVYDGHVVVKLILGIAFIFMTAPVGGQLISRAAYRTKVPMWEGSTHDELKERMAAEELKLKQNS